MSGSALVGLRQAAQGVTVYVTCTAALARRSPATVAAAVELVRRMAPGAKEIVAPGGLAGQHRGRLAVKVNRQGAAHPRVLLLLVEPEGDLGCSTAAEWQAFAEAGLPRFVLFLGGRGLVDGAALHFDPAPADTATAQNAGRLVFVEEVRA